jgi:hypothetical protein
MAIAMAVNTGRKTTRKRPMHLPQNQLPSPTGSDSMYSNVPLSRSPTIERTVVSSTNSGNSAMVICR